MVCIGYLLWTHIDSVNTPGIVLPLIGGMVMMFATYAGTASYSYKLFTDTVAKTNATSTDESPSK